MHACGVMSAIWAMHCMRAYVSIDMDGVEFGVSESVLYLGRASPWTLCVECTRSEHSSL